ncbi:MAG: hypothetical protein O9303_13750, partial [Silanimonas sp.]|nr:hypothetical protein [Silanimonas sp.]
TKEGIRPTWRKDHEGAKALNYEACGLQPTPPEPGLLGHAGKPLCALTLELSGSINREAIDLSA